MGCADDQCAGENPPYGASINYYLKSASEEDIQIAILDKSGQTLRTLKEKGKAGINRIFWDLRDEPTEKVKLRTPPLGFPHVRVGPEGWRDLVGSGRPMTILMPPGDYRVKLIAGGREFTQTLTVLKDPNSAGSEEDIQTQIKLLRDVKGTMAHLVEMINQIEWIKSQIDRLNSLLKDVENTDEVIRTAQELYEKLIAVEEHLFQVRLTGGTAGQDILRWPCKLYRKISSLGSQIASADYPPTEQQYEVHEDFKQRIDSHRKEFEGLLTSELAALNTMLKEKDLPTVYNVKAP
jgi:hypothetical protein